ncbi:MULTISPECIES: ATP-grasp domain-containing protein [Bacillaceae]|uniref:ATP-grasp domain-containing protein n=1 Tax=Evansella alkalicola TaxID=745819 RepID=A0ABS6JXX7_9BACI|nr:MULTISPECIES: ATP-grasp domain-containing protein [Bacillaceae]MBU9723433.1 ATP-grasp domain-containing protein [Bacillus alkalicola]
MDIQKIVAFVEPSFYGVDFVERTYKKGCQVIAIGSSLDNPKKYGYENYYHDFLIADIRDPKSIYNAIKNSKYDGKLDALIPATDYASHYTAEVAEWLSLPTIPSFAANNARNKDLARHAYQKNKVPSALYVKVSDAVQACEAASSIGYPVVLKPTNCASSQGVFFINNKEELLQAFQKLREFKKTYMGFDVSTDYLIEEYLVGPEFSVELFLKDQKVIFSSVTEKETSDLPFFVEISHTVPTSTQLDKVEEMVEVSVQAMRAIGIDNGPSHVEIKLTLSGPKIIEVNGRPGGDQIASQLLFNTYGFDIFEETVNFYLKLPINEHYPAKKATSIAYLTSRNNGEVSKIRGIENIKQDPSVIKFEINVQPGDLVKIPESSDDRLGYVITTGENAVEAKRKAMNLINTIQLVYV